MVEKAKTIVVQNNKITVLLNHNGNDFINITEMIKAKDGNFFITDWLRNRNTLEYLGAWETLNNPDFNYGEFAIIKTHAGLNNFKISVKEWCGREKDVAVRLSRGRCDGLPARDRP